MLTGSFLHDTALTPHFSHGTEHSKGTCILQRPNSLFSSSVQLIDPDGRLVIVKIREGEEDLFLASVKSDVLNAGFMTNYFQVSRGVCQGCPLSPLLFVLSVELLALKIRQDQLCRGIPLPDGQNAKISQFADDTTLILEDTISLRKAMNIVNSFGALSGLQLNKKKTKAMWIGSSSKNKSMPIEFECPKEPIKFLGTFALPRRS